MSDYSDAETIVSVMANGLSIGYSIRGSGPPLILIHGAEADRTMFSAFGANMANRFTVIAYDQRDSGLTRDLAESPRAYGLADMADDAARLIMALGHDKAHVFGTSLGGHIAQVLAARHPACIDRLILGSTWLAGQSLMAASPKAAEQLIAWRSDVALHTADIASLFFSADYLRAHPEGIEMFRGGRRTVGQMERRAKLLGDPYPIQEGEIAPPALLVMGDQDGLIPNPATMAVARLLRQPQVTVLTGIGHIAAIEAPTELAKVVSAFLG
jgi:3-oxoadipate enol-lactonase